MQPPVYVGSYCSHNGDSEEHRTCSRQLQHLGFGASQLQGREALTKQRDRQHDRLVPESFVAKEIIFLLA